MGDIAEMMLDGTLCEGCGVFIGSDVGYPMYCPSCEPPPFVGSGLKSRVNCPTCGKRVKTAGLADHNRVVHGELSND